MLLTGKEVCEELRISASTLSRLVAAGELGCLRIRGSLRFTRADLELYIQKAREERPKPTVKPAAPPETKRPRARSREEILDLEAYRAAGIYREGMPYFKGMKIVIPDPEEVKTGDGGKQQKAGRGPANGSVPQNGKENVK